MRPPQAFLLANKLSNAALLNTQLMELFWMARAGARRCPSLARQVSQPWRPPLTRCDLFVQAYESDPALDTALHADLQAVLDRDPACKKYTQCVLYFKGFQARFRSSPLV